jgi:hypothetical protein
VCANAALSGSHAVAIDQVSRTATATGFRPGDCFAAALAPSTAAAMEAAAPAGMPYLTPAALVDPGDRVYSLLRLQLQLYWNLGCQNLPGSGTAVIAASAASAVGFPSELMRCAATHAPHSSHTFNAVTGGSDSSGLRQLVASALLPLLLDRFRPQLESGSLGHDVLLTVRTKWWARGSCGGHAL